MKRIVIAILVAVSLFILWFLLLTGPRNLSLYPPAAQSLYRLPWPAGVTRWCGQGNRAVISHRGGGEFCYDFMMPVGSDVCAARAGVIHRVVVDHDGNGLNAPNNFIVINHGDGTYGWYVHLKKRGASVQVGERVEQGQKIGASGNVGQSLAPHLHFGVSDTDEMFPTLPVAFADVASDQGIPRMLKRYTSGNTARGGH